ncbi:MAG: hypothetical protein Q8N59_01930 [bacterium]|nr:hypothetical protein [bacterium]
MHETFYGTQALESFFEDFLSIFQMGGVGTFGRNWRNKNIQPERKIIETESVLGRGKYDICPHYQLIETCAEIMGISPTTLLNFKFFCGIILKEDTVGGGCFGHSRFFSQNHIPFTSCFAIMYILEEAVKLAKSEKPAEIKISLRPTKEEVEKVNSYAVGEKKYNHGRQIIALWARTVPRTLRIRKHYSKKDLILTAETLILSLKTQVVGDLNLSDVSLIHRSPICPVAPKHEDNRFGFID